MMNILQNLSQKSFSLKRVKWFDSSLLTNRNTYIHTMKKNVNSNKFPPAHQIYKMMQKHYREQY